MEYINLKTKAMDEKTKKELKKFCQHLNTYKGLEEIRFDFMLLDYLNKTNDK